MFRLIVLMISGLFAFAAFAEEVGSVDTTFRVMGANDKIVVEVFDDPKVSGVSCYISRAKTGGISGSVGMAEDTSDASVACRQVGDSVAFTGRIPRQEDVFTERASMLFKKVRVVRMVDAKRNVLTYLVYSDKLIDGSPKNNITAVAIPKNIRIPLK
jgi:CreA protein